VAFNGAGVFSLVAGNPVVTGTTISSTWANNTLSDIAQNGLTVCLTKDGQTTPTANLNFGGFRITNVGITAIAGSVGTPSINLSDTGTGFYRSAADQIGISVNGSQVGFFASTGLTLGNLTAGRVPIVGASGLITDNAFLSYAASQGSLAWGGQSVTADAPVANIQQTWNEGSTTFRGILLRITNTASAATSLLADLQVGGSSLFSVDVGGNLLSGCAATPSASVSGVALRNPRTQGTTLFSVGNVTDARSLIDFVNGNGAVGGITVNGSATAYNTSSDGRRKPHREPILDSGAILDALEPIYHNWDNELNARIPGFVAQDLYEIVPTAVTPGDDDPDKRPGDEGYKGWLREDSKLIPYLVAEIKSLRARVAELETA